MWLLLVLHQIVTLNTNILKVFQVTLQLLVRDYYICKKSKFLTSLPPIPPHAHAYKKWLILKKENLSTPLSFIFTLKK